MVVGDLVLQMAADIARFRSDMTQVQSATQRTASIAESAASAIRTAFAGISVGFLVREFVELADGMQMVEAKLKLATSSQKDYKLALSDVYEISQRNKTSIDSTTKLYSRLNPVIEKLGGTTATTAAVTEAVSAALRVSGATASESSSTMIQLSQALASGVLRGEEFNSVSENGARLLTSLEKELGKSRGELRKMAEQGKLTSDVVANALIKDLQKLKAEAATMPLTVSAAFQMLKNDLMVYAGEVNKSTGLTTSLANGIEFLSKHVRALGDAIITGTKVAIAYFAIFKGGPVIIGAVSAAFNVLMAALARYSTAGVLGATATTGLTGSLILANSATMTLVGGVSMLQAAFGVLFAAFAGWQIGTWAKENFLEVELFGIAMVNGLLKSWQYLKFGFNAVVEGIVWAWEKAIGSIQGFVGWFLENFAEGLKKLGLSESAAKVMEWADSFKNVSKEVKTLEERMKPLRAARDKELEQIDAITGEMAEYAIEQRAVNEQVQRAVKPLKEARDATEDKADAEKRAKEAAKALEAAQKELDKSIDATIDSIMESIDATLKANASAQQQIEDIQFETEMLKLSNSERAVAIELRKLEQAGIKKGTEAYEEYAEQIRAAVLEREAVEESIALAKQQADEIQKLNDDIGRGLTDALMRAFESGKGFFDTLWSGIKNTFKTTVLKMLINPIQQGMSGFIGSALGLGSGAAAAGTGGEGGGGGFGNILGAVGNIVSMGKSLWSFASGGWYDTVMGGVGKVVSGLNYGGFYDTANLVANNAGMITNVLGGVGGFLAGRGVGQMISGGYGLGGGSGNSAVNIGAAIGALAGPIGSVIGGAIGGLVNRAFGRKQKEQTDGGVVGNIVGGDFSGQTFSEWLQKGGWFRSDRRGTDLAAMPDELAQIFDQGARAVYGQVNDYAKALGLPVESLKDVSYSLRVSLGEDQKKNEQAINAAFTAYQLALSSKFATILAPFQAAGETLTDTLARLATLEMFSASVNELGGVFSRVAELSFGAREAIIGMAGGLEAFLTKAQAFVGEYYSEAEKAGLQARQLLEYFASVGIDTAGLTSREAFRSLVESLDVSTELGQKQLVALLDIGPQFAQVADYLTEQSTTLEALAAQAPTVAVLTTLADRAAQQQSELEQQTDTGELTLTAITDGFVGLEESFMSGVAALNGSIGRLNNYFAAWDNGDSLNVTTVTP